MTSLINIRDLCGSFAEERDRDLKQGHSQPTVIGMVYQDPLLGQFGLSLKRVL